MSEFTLVHATTASQHMDRYLQKNDDHQTLLYQTLVHEESIQKHLEEGAAASIFVRGYIPGSLICTLPMEERPSSNSFEYSPPVTNIKGDVIAAIDIAMAVRIADLIAAKAARAVIGTVSSKDVKFNHYPPSLKIGDYVRRGPNWTYGTQDHKSGLLPCVGIVLGVSGSSVTVAWGSSPIIYDSKKLSQNMYVYDASSSQYGLCLVDPTNQNFNPVIGAEKFKVGDKVRLSPYLKGSTLAYWNHDLTIPKTSKFTCKGCGKSGPSPDTGKLSCSKCSKCEKCCMFQNDNDGWAEKQFRDAGTVALKNIDGSKNVITSDYKIHFKQNGTSVGDIKLHSTAEMSKFYYEVEVKVVVSFLPYSDTMFTPLFITFLFFLFLHA